MHETGNILDYSGPVDYTIIDNILTSLKKTKQFITLPKISSKRIYVVIVECLENIAKHSLKDISVRSAKQPFISVDEKNDKIVITSGNPVNDDKKCRLTRILDKLNNLGKEDLCVLYEKRINRESKPEDNGAGIGFITMKLRSGQPFNYRFTTIDENLSDFELQISVNKHIMRKLIIEQTANSPKVVFDPEKNFFEISGESRPSDVATFYNEILTWFDDYSSYLKTHQSNEPVVINMDFDYFNSSSAKYILDFCKQVATVRTKRENVMVKWHYEEDDIDMLEVGKEMSKIAKFPFEYVQKGY